MDYLIEEARREMKRDGQQATFKKIAPYVVAIATVSIIIVAGGLTARYYYRVSQERATFDYMKAVLEDNAKEKEQQLRDIARQGTTPFSYISNIRLAAENKPTEKQSATYTPLPKPLASFAGSPAAPEEAKQFAELTELYGRLEDADKPEEAASLADDLAILAADPNAIWKYSLKELHALALLRADRRADSRAAFTVLSEDANTPDGIRARAKELAAALASSADTKKDASPKE